MAVAIHRVVPPFHERNFEVALCRRGTSVAQPDTRSTPARRRPISSAIAASPLEKIPARCVSEAEMLLADPVALDHWLTEPLVGVALKHQGLDVGELYTAVVRTLGHGTSPEACGHAKQFARKVLAQVCWEMELCQESAADAPREAQVSGPSRGVRSQERLERSASPGSRSVPHPVGHSPSPCCVPLSSASSFGGSSVPHPMQYQSPRKANRLVQGRLAETRRVSRERAQVQMKTQLDEAKRQWERKSKALEETKQLRAKRIEELRDRTRQRNRLRELQKVGVDLEPFEQTRRQDERCDTDARERNRSSDQASRPRPSQQEAAEPRGGRTTLRGDCRQAKADHCRMQAEADERRMAALRARSAGGPELKAARELAKQQVARVERIREQEREALRQRIQAQSKSSPTSARVLRPRSKTPVSNGVSRAGTRATSARRAHTPSMSATVKTLAPQAPRRQESQPPQRSSGRHFDWDSEVDEIDDFGQSAQSFHFTSFRRNAGDVSPDPPLVDAQSLCEHSFPRGAPEPDVVPWPAVSSGVRRLQKSGQANIRVASGDREQNQSANPVSEQSCCWPAYPPEVRDISSMSDVILVNGLSCGLEETESAKLLDTASVENVMKAAWCNFTSYVHDVEDNSKDGAVECSINVHTAPVVPARPRADIPDEDLEHDPGNALLGLFGFLPQSGWEEPLSAAECQDMAEAAATSFGDLLTWSMSPDAPEETDERSWRTVSLHRSVFASERLDVRQRSQQRAVLGSAHSAGKSL